LSLTFNSSIKNPVWLCLTSHSPLADSYVDESQDIDETEQDDCWNFDLDCWK